MKPLARKVVRYAVRGALGLLLLLLLAVGVVGFAGGRPFVERHEAPAHEIVVPADPAAIAEGERLTKIWGCVGCHERDAGGGVLFESPLGDRLVAPNLTRVVRDYDPAMLERAIRHGVKPDGSSMIVMPSSMFAHASDEDLGRVIAYLRSLPPVPDSLPGNRMSLLARFFALVGDLQLEAAAIDHDAPHGVSPDSLHAGSTRDDTLALGRYLARTTCPECHQADLRGSDSPDGPPDLRIAAAYPPDRFRRLMREGIALDGEERGLMTVIARGRTVHLTDDELAALHAYLSTLAD